jgi:hypothetical protein
MDPISTLLYQYGAPTGTSLQPTESSKPILAPGYELCLWLINMVQDKPFSGKVDEKPYSHLREFEQTCACLDEDISAVRASSSDNHSPSNMNIINPGPLTRSHAKKL